MLQVGCCGAHGESDYYDSNRSPPDSCVDKYHVGGLFFERGCGYQFSVYMKIWSGCISAITVLFAAMQVCNICSFNIF